MLFFIYSSELLVEKFLYNWLMGKTFRRQFLMGRYPNWMEKEISALPCGFDLLVDLQ